MRILRFTAEWCQPCKALAKNIESADIQIPIQVIDIDAESDLALEFGIRSVPTMIMLDGNTEVKRKSGTMGVEELRGWING
jgi:thioredoxin-like negative regulator of GroEL